MARSSRSRLARATRSAGLAVLAGGVALVAGCSTDLLEVEDPDIVNPSTVQSPAGAEAVRVGALARFNAATSGGDTNGEGLFLLGGLFADEWINGDSFIARQEIDQRVITIQNNFLTNANRMLHRARLSAEQAVSLLQQYSPLAPAWQVAEMHFLQAYIVNIMAEHYCSGLVFSTVVDGREQLGSPVTSAAALERALGHANDGLALVTGTTANDLRVRHALQVVRGRILLNLARYSEAATAVAGVPNNFAWNNFHSAASTPNYTWQRNNIDRRYNVSTGEGINGLNFATAADPRVPVCVGGTAACQAIGVTQNRRDDLAQPLYVQMIWPQRESPVAVLRGVDARMIEAEAQLRADNPEGMLATLNAARATVQGLAPLTDPGTEAGRVDLLFRERAFWQFGRGYRVGDMRRLVRQYGRTADTVFPTGAWHKSGNYGGDVTLPIPQAELNNPNVSGQICLDRGA